jgi:CheY-like chemotaxis protein
MMNGQQPRALIVDDTEDVADLVAAIFRQAGFSARVCYSAPDALEAAKGELFPVVLSDIAMPRMNGYELAAALRAIPAYRRSALIAVTGMSMYDDRARSFAAGFDYHFTKPIEAVTFISFLVRLKDEI